MAEERMTCREVQTAIAELIGGEGSEERRSGVRRHAAVCSECANLTDDLDDLVELAGSLRTLESPVRANPYWVDFRVELRQRIEAGQPRSVGPATWLYATLATLALVLLTAIGGAPIGSGLGHEVDRSAAVDDEAVAIALEALSLPDSDALEVDLQALILSEQGDSSVLELIAMDDGLLELDDWIDEVLDDEALDELPG